MDILEIIDTIKTMHNNVSQTKSPEYATGALQGYLAVALDNLKHSNPNFYESMINLIKKDAE